MSSKDAKTSKIISASDYLRKKSNISSSKTSDVNHTKSSQNDARTDIKPLRYHTNKTIHSYLPNEVLIKIFHHLSITDLLKCSLVSRQWNEMASLEYFWTKWAKKLKCDSQLKRLIEDTGFTPRVCFKKLYEQRLELALFKLSQKLSKKTNKYTNLPDLNIFKADIRADWFLEFYDKRDKLMYSLVTNEQNNFEAGFSIVWSDLPDINDDTRKETTKMKLSINVPFYIDLKNGALVNQKSRHTSDNINKKLVIKEFEFNFRNFRKSSLVFEDQVVEMHNFEQEFLFGIWKSKDQSQQFAFISVHLIFDFDLLNKIFPLEPEKKKDKAKNKFESDLELDSKYGLHDYSIYFCIRNQTKTIFLSHTSIVYKASFKKHMESEYVYLNVLDCDMMDKVGPCLKMLPKFTWKSLINPKNNIDLFGIVDFCVFDSNNRLIISNSFPINFGSTNFHQNASENFVVSEDLKFEFSDKKFLLKASISSLKDEFSMNNNDDVSYFLTNFEIFLPLEFVDKTFGTQFQKNQNSKKTF